MQTMKFNDSWVIVEGVHETDSDANTASGEYSVTEPSPDWFWTGRRWSSQSARSKVFASKRAAQTEMGRIRTSAD